MKDHTNFQRTARASYILLGALILAGMVMPVKAAKLSPGMDILSRDTNIATHGLVNTDVYMSREDLSEALGVDSVGKITVVSLPDPTLGRLQLGSRYVEVGQTIAEVNIDNLKFVPFGSNELAATFSFCRGSSTDGTVYSCTVYTLKKVNLAPVFTADAIAGASGTEASVYSGVIHLGTLMASDPEGDALTFEILSSPTHGTVKLTDKARGYYEYTSDDTYTGKDSFTVRVTDKYGNRSEALKVVLRVGSVNDSEVFADMEGHFANEAVISCIRAGVIDSPEGNGLFYPNEYISRAEFLSLAMNGTGYAGFSANATAFADDADIPEKYKGSIAAAHALGFIDGIETQSGLCFCPNNQITRSEAAVIVSRLTGISGDGTVAVFAADDAVPTWARSAMEGLHTAGILRGSGTGSIDAYAPLTRGAAMQMISSLIGIN